MNRVYKRFERVLGLWRVSFTPLDSSDRLRDFTFPMAERSKRSANAPGLCVTSRRSTVWTWTTQWPGWCRTQAHARAVRQTPGELAFWYDIGSIEQVVAMRADTDLSPELGSRYALITSTEHSQLAPPICYSVFDCCTCL